MKISDKLAAREPGRVSYSFEYFCPKTEQGVFNLIDRIDRMVKLEPLFVDVTWNAGGSSSAETTLELVEVAQNDLQVDTCMHMTAVGMSDAEVDAALNHAVAAGCHNILALRGDPPKPRSPGPGGEGAAPAAEPFQYAKDLVAHIRRRFGDDVSIGVAGYPEGHLEETDIDLLVAYLKEKVDAGADFVVTQMFYDADLFVAWWQKVRAAGITVPIVPGIMPISGWASFLRRARWCQINLPAAWVAELEPLCHDDAAVRARGTQLVAQLCRDIMARTDVTHLHFYTMNLEKAVHMCLDELRVAPSESAIEETLLTHAQAQTHAQAKLRRRRGSSLNAVKPIHWKNRPLSYSSRTAEWDEFPNGRWGDSRSPAFDQLNELDALLKVSSASARKRWGHPTSASDVGRLVQQYTRGELASLPWSDAAAAPEIGAITTQIHSLNNGSRDWFTVNSQPAVDGAPSSDPVHGWGPSHGSVYQKAYVELLMSPELWEATLLPRLQQVPHHEATFYAVRAGSDELTTNARDDEVNAVTWGIFPGKEVVQPTIVEGASFMAWKDEAFRIALEWSRCYHAGSESQRFLTAIARDWVLVNIVHHDFHSPDKVFDLLR